MIVFCLNASYFVLSHSVLHIGGLILIPVCWHQFPNNDHGCLFLFYDHHPSRYTDFQRPIGIMVSTMWKVITGYLIAYTVSRFRFFSCLVSSFPVLFWKSLTSLSFQVSCPSSCVKCLIIFPDSQSVSTCSPWFLMWSNSLHLPLSRASVLYSFMSFTTSVLNHDIHSHRIHEPGVERSSFRAILFVSFP